LLFAQKARSRALFAYVSFYRTGCDGSKLRYTGRFHAVDGFSNRKNRSFSGRPDAIASANGEQLAMFSLALVRQDRFSEGTLAKPMMLPPRHSGEHKLTFKQAGCLWDRW
jgi:hypothetical protein